MFLSLSEQKGTLKKLCVHRQHVEKKYEFADIEYSKTYAYPKGKQRDIEIQYDKSNLFYKKMACMILNAQSPNVERFI